MTPENPLDEFIVDETPLELVRSKTIAEKLFADGLAAEKAKAEEESRRIAATYEMLVRSGLRPFLGKTAEEKLEKESRFKRPKEMSTMAILEKNYKEARKLLPFL